MRINTTPTLWMAGLLSLAANGLTLADSPHLQAHIAGTRQNNTWFLCMTEEAGCFSLHAASSGKVFPLTPGKIQKAYLLNSKTLKLAAQTLPASCNVSVHENQTLHVRGTIHADREQRASIEQMDCELTG